MAITHSFGISAHPLHPWAANHGQMRDPVKNGGTLLVVDDEAGIREVIALTLEAGGHECVAAADGRAALALFREREQDIQGVITDLNMPEMDGISLARQLREISPNLPILISTGSMSEESRQALEELGTTDVLPKPYTAAQLLRCVAPMIEAAPLPAAA